MRVIKQGSDSVSIANIAQSLLGKTGAVRDAVAEAIKGIVNRNVWLNDIKLGTWAVDKDGVQYLEAMSSDGTNMTNLLKLLRELEMRISSLESILDNLDFGKLWTEIDRLKQTMDNLQASFASFRNATEQSLRGMRDSIDDIIAEQIKLQAGIDGLAALITDLEQALNAEIARSTAKDAEHSSDIAELFDQAWLAVSPVAIPDAATALSQWLAIKNAPAREGVAIIDQTNGSLWKYGEGANGDAFFKIATGAMGIFTNDSLGGITGKEADGYVAWDGSSQGNGKVYGWENKASNIGNIALENADEPPIDTPAMPNVGIWAAVQAIWKRLRALYATFNRAIANPLGGAIGSIMATTAQGPGFVSLYTVASSLAGQSAFADTYAKKTELPAPYASNPAALGTANPGNSDQFSRGDHVHPSPAQNIGTVAASSVTIGTTESTAKFSTAALSLTLANWLIQIGQKINGIIAALGGKQATMQYSFAANGGTAQSIKLGQGGNESAAVFLISGTGQAGYGRPGMLIVQFRKGDASNPHSLEVYDAALSNSDRVQIGVRLNGSAYELWLNRDVWCQSMRITVLAAHGFTLDMTAQTLPSGVTFAAKANLIAAEGSLMQHIMGNGALRNIPSRIKSVSSGDVVNATDGINSIFDWTNVSYNNTLYIKPENLASAQQYVGLDIYVRISMAANGGSGNIYIASRYHDNSAYITSSLYGCGGGKSIAHFKLVDFGSSRFAFHLVESHGAVW